MNPDDLINVSKPNKFQVNIVFESGICRKATIEMTHNIFEIKTAIENRIPINTVDNGIIVADPNHIDWLEIIPLEEVDPTDISPSGTKY